MGFVVNAFELFFILERLLFVSDLRQVGDFLWVLRFPSPIKLTATNGTSSSGGGMIATEG
jgi:hypothetical protein